MGGNLRVVRLALVLLLVAMLTGLTGLSAQAAISDLSSLGSPTHPSESTWYADDSPSFEWSSDFPSLLGSADTTGSALDIAVSGNVAYVADEFQGIHSFDITDPSNPVHLDSLSGSVAEEIVVEGDVVYVAGRDTGLFAIDASDPENLVLLDFLGTSNGMNGGAWSVDVCGDMAYITSESESVVRSIDVSDPTNLAIADTLTMNHLTTDITVAGDVAYVAENDWGMHSVDVRDPYNLVYMDTYSGSGVKDVEVAGDVAYLSINSTGLETVDISNPSNMVGLDAYAGSALYGRGLDVVGDLAFLAAATEGVEVFDVSDPSDLTLLGEYDTTGWAFGVAVRGDAAFVAAGTEGIVVLDIMDLVALNVVDSWDPTPTVFGVEVAGNVAYVANDSDGLTMMNISDPEAISVLASFDTTGAARGVAVDGNTVYVADWGEGLEVIDISDPANPSHLASFPTTDSPWEVMVEGDIAYLSANGDGLRLLDVSDPANPTETDFYDFSFAQAVDVEGNYAYLANRTGLWVLDVSDPYSVSKLASVNTTGLAWDVTVEGDMAYVADRTNGLAVYDVSDPGTPSLAGTYPAGGEDFMALRAVGDTLYVATSDGLLRLDISDPSVPSLIDSTDFGEAADTTCRPAVAGDLAFLPVQAYGLQVIQVGAYPVGFSYDLDQTEDTDPDSTADGTVASKAYAGIADGDWYFHVSNVDRFGTALSSTLHRKVRIDTTDPSTSSNAQASYTEKADITLSAEDGSGSGIDSTVYTVDGGTEQVGTSVSVNTIGDHTLMFWSTDLAGNEELPHNTAKFTIASAEVALVPIAGTDRYRTAVEASKEAYPSGADTVVIATGMNWPDALGGAALAGTVEGPLLLTKPGELPSAVVSEITRLKAKNAYILGGTAAVTQAVEDALNAKLSGTVTRLAGQSRYGTANAVADETIRLQGSEFAGGAYIATGDNFPDALGASPLAASSGAPILLTKTGGTPYLPSKVDSAVILGGPAAVTAATEAAVRTSLGTSKVTRVGGTDRYDTAAKVADYGVAHGMHWDGVGIATGLEFPDALSGGAMLGQMDSVLLLTKQASLSSPARARLSDNSGNIAKVHFIGGTAAVSQVVRDEVAKELK